VTGVALVVALVSCVGFASVAGANVYRLSGPIVQRQGTAPGAYEFGYRGPRFLVTPLGTSVDTYVCPSGQSISNWVVVGDVPDSVFGGEFWQWSTGSGSQINVHVVNWSPPPSPHGIFYLRLAGSCTTNPGEFPYDPGGCFGDFCPPYPPGDYLPYWQFVFNTGSRSAGAAQYAELIKRAFCWSSTYPGCAVGAPKPTRRFALHNGTNKISLTFRHSSGTRPPAVRLRGAAGCTARRMDVSAQNRSGYLRLVLLCHGLKRGAAVRVLFVKPVRRSFRLRRGRGSIRVRLAKPPGTVKPLVYLGYGRADKSCSNVLDRLRLRSRTLDVRVSARCGLAAGNSVANIYIGGLLR
jgi:hypothetical protein